MRSVRAPCTSFLCKEVCQSLIACKRDSVIHSGNASKRLQSTNEMRSELTQIQKAGASQAGRSTCTLSSLLPTPRFPSPGVLPPSSETPLWPPLSPLPAQEMAMIAGGFVADDQPASVYKNVCTVTGDSRGNPPPQAGSSCFIVGVPRGKCTGASFGLP